MTVFDLKSLSCYGQTFSNSSKGLANVQRSISLLATNGIFPKTRFQQMRSSVSRQSSNKDFLMPRPVPLHGVCPANFQRKSAGHRNMSASNAAEAISRWNKRQSLTQYSGRGKRKTPLANIRGLCTGTHQKSKTTLCQRKFRRRTKANSLCFRFHNYRPLPYFVSVGTVPQTQKRHKASHADGPERLDSVLYTHNERQSRGCKSHRLSAYRTRRFLYYGSRLSRLRTAISFFKELGLFRNTSQEKTCLCLTSLSTCRQNHRLAKRSDHQVNRPENIRTLSRSAQANRLLRYRYEQAIRISDKQLRSRCADYSKALQVPLADRVVLQVDQAAPANQSFLRHLAKRRQDSDMDRHQCLSGCSHHEKRTWIRAEFVRNPANSQHYTFSQRAYNTSTYENKTAKPKHHRS